MSKLSDNQKHILRKFLKAKTEFDKRLEEERAATKRKEDAYTEMDDIRDTLRKIVPNGYYKIGNWLLDKNTTNVRVIPLTEDLDAEEADTQDSGQES